MEGRASAFIFFMVLGIVCAGAYTAFQVIQQSGTLVSFGEAIPTEAAGASELLNPSFPTLTVQPLPATETPIFVPPTPANATPTPTPTITATPTPLPPISVSTPTASVSVTGVAGSPAAGASPTAPSGASPRAGTSTPLAPSRTPTPNIPTWTPAPTQTPLPPTSTPPPPTPTTPPPPPPTATVGFTFQVAGLRPDFEKGCTGHYIYGTVRDSAGAPLIGVRLRAYDLYGNDLGVVFTKDAPAGGYDFVISPARDTWTVLVVDEAGQPLSAPVDVYHAGELVPGESACWHQLDWVRR